MAGYLDNITASRSNRLQRTNSGAAVSPQDRALIDQSAAARGNEFRKGLRRAVFNATATTDAFIGQMAEPFAPDFADRQFERAESTLRNQPVELRPAVAGFRQVNDLPSAVQYASGALGEGLASVGAMVAAGLLSRGAAFRAAPAVRNAAQYGGGVAAMLPQEGGETALTLRQNPEAMANTTAAERAALTLGRGTVNAALENIVPQALFTNQILGRAGRIAAGMRPAVENIARKSAAGVVGEAGTEAAQEFTGQFAENVAVPGTGYDTERAMEAAVRGAITGGVLGGAGGTVQAVRSNIDAAAEQAREAAGNVDTADILNRTVERIDNIVRNPEQAGIDLTNTTMGALAEASARAGDLREQASERAGPATARGMDAVATMRRNLDRGILRRLTPENREKYRELTQNFRLLQPTEYARLRDAMDTADATEINRAVGDVAAQLYERVPRETMVGLRNLAKWGRDFGRGVTGAAREGRKAAQSYGPEDVARFREFLSQQYRQVLQTMDNTDASTELARTLMAYRDSAQLLNTELRPKDREAIAYFEQETGVSLPDLLTNARQWRNDNTTPAEAETAFEETTGDSQIERLTNDMERFLTPKLQEQLAEAGISIGPGATDRADGSVRRDSDGELMNEEDTRRSPFNSLGQIQRLLAEDLSNGEPIRSSRRRFNPEYVLPATLRSDTLSAAQIGRLLGGKDTYRTPDGEYARRSVPVNDDTIAMRTTEDGGYRQDFNSIDIVAQAGTPQERGGSRENMEAFLPDFMGTAQDATLDVNRLLAAVASINTDGLEIPRSDIDPALLEEWGLDPDGDPIQINVEMDMGTIGAGTRVRARGQNRTIGQILASARRNNGPEESELDAEGEERQLAVLDETRPEPGAEDIPQQRLYDADFEEVRRRTPEGIETSLRQAGIDQRRDSEAVRPEDVPRETPPVEPQAENVPRETPPPPAPVPEQPTAAPMPIRINGTQYMVIVEEQPNAAGNIAWNRADGVHMVRGLTKERIIEYLQKPELRTAVQRRQAEVREQVSQRFEAEYGNSFVDLVSDLSEQQLKQLIILHESRHAQQRKKYGKEFGTTYRERPVDFEFDANRFALRELGIIDNESVPRETPPENIAVMPIEQERRLRETLMEQEAQIEAVMEDAREDGGPLGPPEPPQEPPEPPQEPPAPPPPPPDKEARERFKATVQRLLGDRVDVAFDQDLPKGVAAEYDSDFALPVADTDNVRQEIYRKRREELRALKRRRNATPEDIRDGKADPRTPEQIKAAIEELNKKEQDYITDRATRGTIRVAAGMEAQAGLAEHEALHAAFEIFFGQDNAQDRRILATAFTQGLVGRRLRNYFRDNEAVLNVIDPSRPDTFREEEAAAYGFQLFLHEPEALQLGRQVEGIFNRFIAFLQRLVGYQTYEQRARLILNDLASGRRAERGVSVLRERESMERSMLNRSQDFVRNVGSGFMHIYDTVFSSAYSRLADSGNPALAQIARLGYNETGEEGQGMIQRQRHETTRWGNRLKEALHALDADELTELNRLMILGEKATGRLKQPQERLQRLLKDAHQYQVDAGTEIGFKDNYYPLIWNPEKVIANQEGFLKMLRKYESQLAEANATPDEMLDRIMAYESRGHEFQGVFNENGEPAADSSLRRALDFIELEDRLPFMEDDLVVTMAHYLNQSVRHAEFVRAYGKEGERLQRLLSEVRGVYKGTTDDQRLAKDYIDGLMGNKEVGMSRELKDVYGAMVTYQNVRLLPLSVFSSLVDPLGIAVRTNNMAGAFDAFAYSVKNIFTDFRKEWTPDQWAQFAEDMGTIDLSGTVKSIDKIYTGVTLRGKTREINDAFFKYNLLNGWVKNNHIAATKAAQLFLRRSAEGMFGEERSADNLQEVGVRPEDIMFDENLGRIRATVPEILGIEIEQLEAFEQENPQAVAEARAQAERIQQAIHKIVRQSMIQPSSADMPNWMSNPYLAPIAHLKTFVFGFNATILQRLVHEAKRGNYSPAYYAAAYVPGMIAADFIKGLAGNGGEEPEWKKNWSLGDYVEHGVHRSGLTGTGQFLTDMGNDITRGGGGWESIAGPSVEQAQDLLAAMNAETSQPTRTWVVNALPANDLYDQWLRN
jgi:predicted RNA-binding protein YlqC (UPF0109 family)